MPDPIPERLNADEFDALARLIDAGVVELHERRLSRDAFLDWCAREGPRFQPLLPQAGVPAVRWYRALGAVLFDALPMPPTFRQGRVERPGRNDPCLCGSGEKFKQCCGPFAAEFDFSDYNLLRHVLHELPAAVGEGLVHSQVDAKALAEFIDDWFDDHDFERVARVLAPWFDAESGKFNQGSVPLLGALASALLELDRDAEAQALVERVLARGDRQLRAEGFRTRAYMLLDRHDFDAAWEDFAEVRRLAPSAPSNATLELSILLKSQRFDEARERARYWLPRLERNTAREADAPLEFVERVIADPETALDAPSPRGEYPELVAIERLLQAASPVAVPAPATCSADGELVLATPAALRRVETRWSDVFPVRKPPAQELFEINDDAWDASEAWLDFLASAPEAWQSIEVLDDLVTSILGLLGPDTEDPLLDGLLDRGHALVCAQVAPAGVAAGRLEWDLRENRAALRLLATRALRGLRPGPVALPDGGTAFIDQIELIQQLDPGDHFQLGGLLAGVLLMRGDASRVLSLPPPTAGDATARLNRVLALHLGGEDAEARAALAAVARDFPDTLSLLIAESLPTPEAGAETLAWTYCAMMKPVWAETGALAWLAAALPGD